MSTNRLKKIANRSLQNAGARYTPRVDSHAPNLEITYLIDSMNCLIRGKFLSDSFNEFLTAITNGYCSHDYQQLLAENGFIFSMSKRGDCFDNAAMESWNHSLKVEAIHGEKFLTRAHAKNHVFDYIEVYNNKKRLHSRLGYLSPVYFEAKMAA